MDEIVATYKIKFKSSNIKTESNKYKKRNYKNKKRKTVFLSNLSTFKCFIFDERRDNSQSVKYFIREIMILNRYTQ